MILSRDISFRWLSILFVLLAGITLSNATNYVVSSASQISSVMSSVQPGDTLTMTSGTWTNQLIVFKGNGTVNQPILLRSEGGYGSVILNGTSTLRIGGDYLIVDGLKFQNGYSSSGSVIEFRNPSNGVGSNYCRLTNSAVISYNPTNDSTDYKWVSLYGTHNRVDHCHLEDKTHSGTTLVVWRSTTAPDYHLIDHNYFGPRPVLGYNGGETIRVGTSDQSLSSSYSIVEYNLFDRCNGEIEVISNKSCDNIYRYNTFISCEAALTLRHGNRCLVEGNFFFGNKKPNSGGIRIIGEDHVVINNYISGTDGSSLKSALTLMDGIPDSPLNGYFQVKRALVAFNTLVNNHYSINLGGGKDVDNILPPLDCIIANNIVQSTYSPLITQTDSTINTTWQSNIFYGASLGMSPVPAGITITDPKLSTVGGDSIRHLSGTSPAINTAQGTYSMVTLDLDGQTRDLQKDIGADEYSADPYSIRPLTVNDVGPNAVSFTITVSQPIHGTITPGTTSVRSGESQRFFVNPDPGYHIDSIIVDGLYIPDSTASYTFKNIIAGHTLTARLSIKQFTLSVNAVNGSVLKNPDLALYDSGSTVELTASASAGYYFLNWSGDTNSTSNPIQITMDKNKNIAANFESNGFTTIVHAGWNLLSLPLNTTENLANLLYPTAISSPFIFNGSYDIKDTMMNGYGFWIKFATADTIVYNGSPIISDTIHLKSGWNLIGSISTPLNTSMIVADPPESIVSQYFLYDGSSYHTTDTIKPGLGYWVKANGVAALILSGTTQKKSVIPSKILPEGIQIDSALLKKINR
jgi:poly(beta-D-mannuronate) lyase